MSEPTEPMPTEYEPIEPPRPERTGPYGAQEELPDVPVTAQTIKNVLRRDRMIS